MLAMQRSIDEAQAKLKQMQAETLAEFAHQKLGVKTREELSSLVSMTALTFMPAPVVLNPEKIILHSESLGPRKRGRPPGSSNNNPMKPHKRTRTAITDNIRMRVKSMLRQQPTISNSGLANHFGFSETTASRLKSELR